MTPTHANLRLALLPAPPLPCSLFPPDQVGEIAGHANDRKLAAKSVQDGSLRLYLCVMLHRAPLVCDAGKGWDVALLHCGFGRTCASASCRTAHRWSATRVRARWWVRE